MTIAAVMIAGLLVAAATPGWEFARWGMTPAELRAASHGSVTAKDPFPGYDEMTGEYAMGKFRFGVVFDYAPPSDDPGDMDPAKLGLDGVLLNLDLGSGACADLESYLQTIYGKPDRTTTVGSLYLDWNKPDRGDDITYHVQGKGCMVLYGPLGGG